MAKPMVSVGVDLSTKATGLVILEEMSDQKSPHLHREETVVPPAGLKGMARARSIVLDVMTMIHDVMPCRVVVEGYSLNMQNASSVVPLVELGGLLRFMLHIDGMTWLDPRATELKKFVVGKGNVQKSHMMMHVLDRWGYKAGNDNLADAYGLACMGLAHANCLRGATLEQRKVVGALKLRSD